MRRGTRVLSLFGITVLLLVAFQPVQAKAAGPSDPENVNYASPAHGAAASAGTWSSGYEPAKAIDGSTGTAWRATANDALTVTFDGERDIREVHVHLSDYAMPEVDLYYQDAAGSFVLLESWSGNTATTLIHNAAGGVAAYGIQVGFPSPLTHTHSYTHTHQTCTSWHWHSGGPTPMGAELDGAGGSGYWHCHAWSSYQETHTYAETHYARVAEGEAWGIDPDADGDGLGDAFEEGVRYRQEAIVAGLPVDIPDNGTDVLVFPLERPLWSGVATAAFLDLEVDLASTGDLVVAVGYWDGSAWDDRLAWVPGDFANSSIWATTVVEHLHTSQVCTEWHIHSLPEGGGEYPHCHAYETQYESHFHNYPSIPTAGGTSGQLSLSTSWSPTASASTASGSVSHVTIDLRKAALEAWETDAGFRTPAFSQADLQGRTQWRLLVRDWNPYGGSGSLLSARLLTEERSDPATADTDGDGVLEDGAEVSLGAFPVALDTDWDDLSDVFEKDAHALTLTIDGVTVTRSVETDPADGDSDGDGLGDGEEWFPGFDSVITDPTVADTDGDGLEDGAEVMVHYSNATLTDTDGDGFADNVEVNPRSLTLTVNGVSETRSVTTLAYAEDSDGDGLGDYEEWYGTSVYGVKTDPSDPDTDGDGLPDGQERFTAEVSLDKKYDLGTYLQRYLSASLSGTLESASIRYSTSGVDASKLEVKLTHAGKTLTLRDHEGSGPYLTDSYDLTGEFSSYSGSYLVKVWSDVSGGLLEDATLSFTLLTSPVQEDTDGDGLNDTEELTHGADAWITDPNRWDTDGDGWSDGYEVLTKGTSPLSTDTDGDGTLDPNDIDPLRNILVRVYVKKIHQDDPWCSPELVGVVHVNDDYIWVTQHKIANQDSFTSWLCPFPIPTTQYKTASFYYNYYADVPDDVSDVTIRASAWSIVPIFWDGTLLDTTFTYSLGASQSYTLTNGGHSMTLSVYTTYLPKIHTLALTDGNVTAEADTGQVRYVAQDRSFVFLVNATDSYATIAAGMHAFVVPLALYMESKLKARIDGGTTWPLASTEFFAEDDAQAEMSEAVTAVTAGSLTGEETYWLLQYLLQNTTGDLVYEAVDVTSYVPLLNLPTDAINILPWAGVTNGPTGSMPQDFWDWLGSLANTIVNSLITAGQLIYGGLIAIGNFFVALGEAIVAWGMALVGTYQQALAAVQEAVGKAGEILATFVDWAIDWISWIVDSTLGPFIEAITSAWMAWSADLADFVLGSFSSSRLTISGTAFATGVGIRLSTMVNTIVLLFSAARAIETAIVILTGVGAGLLALASEMIKVAVLSIFITATVMATAAIVEDISSGQQEPSGIYSTFANVGAFVALSVSAFQVIQAVNEYVTKRSIPGAIRAFGVAFALAGLAFTLYASAVNVVGSTLLLFDVISLALVGGGLFLMWYSTVHPVDKILSFVSRVVSMTEWILGVAGATGAVVNVLDHVADGNYE